ncbi:MAG: pirin family protein [Planctomycetota bacterium]
MHESIAPRATVLEGLPIQRVLPTRARRSVGPFVFLDQMGPAALLAGAGVDVPPHPHIGLCTLTYLLAGALDHRDSLGVLQTIRPGAVNWMVAGRGVTHSERSPAAERAGAATLDGVQAWVALPPEHEEVAPAFEHHPEASLPVVEREGVALRVLVGAAFGAAAPARTWSPMFYVDARWARDGELILDPALGERAAWPLAGTFSADGLWCPPGHLAVFRDGAPVTLRAEAGTRVLLLGGERRQAPLHVHWNYVSADPARIDAAKARWARGAFPPVVGDDGAPAVDPRP